MKKSNVLLAVLAGCAVFTAASCSGKADDTIKIGCIGPLSGPVAVYGTEAKYGAELAVEEINAAGGVLGKQLVLISEDDEGDAAKTVNAFKKLTVQDGVKVIVGSLTSGCTKAITSQSQAAKVIQMAPAATAENITLDDSGNTIPYVFRACFIDPFQGTVGGKFSVETLGAKNAAILYDIGNDYSVGLTENFDKEFTSKGGKIVAKESYSTGEKDFNAQITKIKNQNPDVVYLPDYYATVALIAKQLRAQGIDCPIVGADGWDGLTDNAQSEVLNGFYSNHYAADSTDPAVVKYVTNFKAKFGKEPTSFAALAYDSVYMLKDAIIKAGGIDKIELVRDALEATDGDYVTGHLTFDENHNPIKSAVMLELVQGPDGKLTTAYKTTVNP
ncbi:MAG: ABC transporter substrate-binding protein [Treponema sp.]|nr:ABC transporter substrate-binding protein [Treponema sp.]